LTGRRTQQKHNPSPTQLSRTVQEQEFFENLSDQRWRINNLYYIKSKQGKRIKFKPNWAQTLLLDNLWYFSIILKARQLGITTFFCILYLDMVLFNEHKTAGIIAHKDKEAKKIFKEKVKFAWDNLPVHLRDELGPPNTDSSNEMAFPNGSSIFVSTSTRGGTIQYLHISEFGYTCAHHPQKAEEIVTGSINSVEQGQIVTIESTAEGKSGYFYEFCKSAQEAFKSKRMLSPLDFRFFFFSWWQHPSYKLETPFVIDAEYELYFKSLQQEYQITLTDEQKRWYIMKKKINGDNMLAEYPSTPEEAFMASIQGAYYANEMSKVHEQKRIRTIAYDPTLTVDTWWDLGMNDKNVILFTQAFGNEIRIIDYYENSGEGLAHYVNYLRDKQYVYGKHSFPHDIRVKELGTGVSRYQTLVDLRMSNIRTIERTNNINDDIEAVRRLFPRFYFDEKNTPKLVESLSSYRKEWNDKTGEFHNRPRHDKHSHAADAMRTLARGWTHQSLAQDGDAAASTEKEKTQDFF